MAINVIVVGGNAHEGRRERLIQALKGAGFLPKSVGETEGDICCPCIAIWAGAQSVELSEQMKVVTKAASEGRLVSVLFEATTLPPSLAPHPVVDLSKWRGSRENPSFSELIGKLKVAALDYAPRTVRAAFTRRVRRLVGGITALAVLSFVFAFTMNILAVQNNLCSINFVQPNLSDICGAWGLGGKPNREERLAWEERPLGSCNALRTHIERFPNGALRSTAADLLDGRRIITQETWVKDHQRLPIFLPIGKEFAELAAAESDALERVTAQAKMVCEGFAASDAYRLLSSSIAPQSFICDRTESGHYCGYDGQAVCLLERQQIENIELCGQVP